MFGIIRQRVIDLAHQQVLTIIQTGHSFFFRYHPATVTVFHSIVKFSVLRKSKMKQKSSVGWPKWPPHLILVRLFQNWGAP